MASILAKSDMTVGTTHGVIGSRFAGPSDPFANVVAEPGALAGLLGSVGVTTDGAIGATTVMPVSEPVMVLVFVSVAVIDWLLPGVFRVALKTCLPASVEV